MLLKAEYNVKDLIMASIPSHPNVIFEIKEVIEIISSVERDPGIYYICSFVGHQEWSDEVISQKDVSQWYPCRPVQITTSPNGVVIPPEMLKEWQDAGKAMCPEEDLIGMGGVLATPAKTLSKKRGK